MNNQEILARLNEALRVKSQRHSSGLWHDEDIYSNFFQTLDELVADLKEAVAEEQS